LFSSTFGTIRALAYDGNHFWTKSFSDPIYEFDVTGALINTYVDANSAYGFAYDSFADCLWLFASPTTFVQYGLDGMPTGTTHAVTLPNAGIIGGAFYYEGGLVPGKTILGCLGQGTPDVVYGMELRDAAPLDSPAAPSDVVVTPDAGGALSADIDWTCPDLTVGGATLTDLDEMRVYRGEDLIYTDTTPVIGGPGSYTDVSVPLAGQYSYRVVGFNDAGEGIPATASVWIGEDVPDAVTDFTLTDISTGDLEALLEWVNPTAGMHGGYFPGVTGYDFERSDGFTFSIAGPVTQWIDDTIVDPGIYSYTITPFNNSGSGPSTQTPSVGIGITVVEVGDTEIGDYEIPMNLYWHNTIVEVVYDKEWIGTDMLINAVAFHAANIGSTINPFNFEIWLGEIDVDDLSGGWIDASQLTMVFDGTIDVPTGDYWLEIPLDTPFEYEYSNNLVMGIIKDDDEYFSTSDTWWTTESGTANRTLHEYSDSEEFSIQSPPGDLTAKTTYPDIRFYYSELAHGDVDGVITDSATSNPINGVEVYVGAFGPVTTNASGEYLIEDIVTGVQDVTATKVGYYDFFGSVEVLPDVVVTYDIGMDPFEFATLDGNVTDVDTGLPIEDAEIYLLSDLGYEYWATTNASGDYSIVDIVADTYDITCTATMYIPQTVQDIVFDPGAAITQDFALQISIYYFSDFEDNDGYLLSNNPSGWQWGAPTSGPGSAQSGTNVWGTVLGGDYPNGSNFTLDATIPVGIVTNAYMLEFWHWYDIEASYDGGNVKVSTDGGTSWSVITPITGYTGTANTSNPLSGEPIFCGHDQQFWELVEFDLSAYVGENILVRWHFGSDSSVPYPGWYIDDVRIYEQVFGSLDGFVTEFGTGTPIPDADITIGLYSGTSDGDGYYFIDDIVTGTYDVECEHEYYLPALVEDVVIEESITTTQDIDMLWSEVAVDVTELTSYLPPDDMEVQTFTITNDGPGDLEYSIGFEFPAEIRVKQVLNTPKLQNSRTTSYVPNQLETRKMNTNLEDITTAEHLSIPSIPSRDAGDILSQFNPTMFPWGIGFDGEFLWLTDAVAADPNIYQYTIDGTATGATINCSSWMGSWVGDMAYTPGYIFAVNVGGDNNIYKLDENTGAVDEIISGAWNTTSARSVTYDPANDEFYIGGWNHTEIYHIDASGATISTIPFASVSGLAWHPSGNNGTGSLWVTESSVANNIYELDPTPGTVLQSFTSPGADYACAGLDIDNVGNLWAIDQGSNTVYNIDSGVPLECWVSCTGNPSGIVPGNGGSIEVEVTFDAAELLIGDELTADLLIHNNSNYTRGDDYIIPVTLIISGNIPPVNLNVDEETALFTWDTPPGSDRTDSGNDKQSKETINNNSRDLLGYNVFLDGDDVGTTTENYWPYDVAELTVGNDYVAGVSAVYDDGESEIQEFPFTYLGTDAGIIIPLVTELRENYPNPFNPETKIAFSLIEPSHVQITIYNIRGQLVKTLIDEQREANNYTVIWNGRDNSSKSVSSGVYFYKMVSEGNIGRYTSTKKMILMK
jgi:hypothetical protein